MKNKIYGLVLSALAASFIMAGCTQQARQDYDQAGEEVQDAAQATGEAIRTDAEVAEEVAEEQVEDTRKVLTAAEMSTQVKTALINAEDLDSDDIDVDTVDKTIYLKGDVDTAGDKERAEALAKQTAGEGYSIINELVVVED